MQLIRDTGTANGDPNAPILFDQDGDGIKIATGWIGSGQGLAVCDLNGKGTSIGPQAGQVNNNNNGVALSTTFTQNGETHTVGAIDLEANNFFTEFPPEVVDEAGNPVTITAQAQALPQMNGSGMVRNMRAAASLSGDFAQALQVFLMGAAATRRTHF